MKTHILDRNNEASWIYMPDFIKRAVEFCKKYDSDANPHFLARQLEINFAADDPQILGIVSLNDEGVVTGHLIASVDEWLGAKFVTVIQYELDEALDPELRKATFDYILNWGASKGATKVQILARNPKVGRVFEKVYKFKPCRIIMRRDI